MFKHKSSCNGFLDSKNLHVSRVCVYTTVAYRIVLSNHNQRVGGSILPVRMPLDKAFYPRLSLSTQV